MKNEGDVKKFVRAVLKDTQKCYWFMPPANGFGRAGIPDFVGWVNGNAFAIETKFGRGECTANQLREIEAGIQAGAKVCAIEANYHAFLRCLIIKNYFDLKAQFLLGDFAKDFGSNSRFDLIVASVFEHVF